MMRIAAVGHAVPDLRVTGAELEVRLGLEAGWIERRTGIRELRHASPAEATSDLATRAGADAIGRAGKWSAPIGLLLLATSTPDHPLPPTAPLVAHQLGLPNCGAFDLAGACSGFLGALALAHSYCTMQRCSVLVVAANVLSRRVNPVDPMTAALFADGAGAMILGPSDDADALLSIHLDSHGDHYEHILIPAGGSRTPITVGAVQRGEHFMRMERGPALFRIAVRAMARAGEAALLKANLSADAIDWWVPHQANARIIREAGERLGIPAERTISIVAEYGNSSAASIPLALSLAVRDGRIRPGKTLLLTSAGAGMIEAGAVLRWSGAAS